MNPSTTQPAQIIQRWQTGSAVTANLKTTDDKRGAGAAFLLGVQTVVDHACVDKIGTGPACLCGWFRASFLIWLHVRYPRQLSNDCGADAIPDCTLLFCFAKWRLCSTREWTKGLRFNFVVFLRRSAV